MRFDVKEKLELFVDYYRTLYSSSESTAEEISKFLAMLKSNS